MLNDNIHLSFRNSNFWRKLLSKKNSISKTTIAKLFLEDPNRTKNFCFNVKDLDLFVDFSKQHIDPEILAILGSAAEYCQLADHITKLFNGSQINITENRSVLHTTLRDPSYQDNITQLGKIEIFINKIYGSKFDSILFLGIGGSYLGPMMSTLALKKYSNSLASRIKFYFISNVDTETTYNILSKLDQNKTIVIVNSKSFSTMETIINTNIVIDWLKRNCNSQNDISKIYSEQIFAVTSDHSISKAIDLGIVIDNIFTFPDQVGGRYSIWSSVGLAMIIQLGMDNFKRFLHGGYIIDNHFKHTKFSENIPVIMALISIWNINFMGYRSLAIVPYLDALEYFPAYLQQLAMESNGKTIDLQNNYINYDTVEIVWGGIGCGVQHSFMQMLHQGSQIVPVDFLFAASSSKFLAANCLAQSQALMEGNQTKIPFKQCNGNRPSTTILFPDLSPEILGALIALYEHKTFVQAILWNINPFDQWGVELGKNLAQEVLKDLSCCEYLNKTKTIDPQKSSTLGLINTYNEINNNYKKLVD